MEPAAVEARLRLVERQLVRHLLRGQSPTLVATARAYHQVLLAQEALLTSETEFAAIVHEWSAERAVDALRWTTQQAGGWLPTLE